jgi:alkylhydroperoxidase family enzyme
MTRPFGRPTPTDAIPFPGTTRRADQPRVQPGSTRELGLLNSLIVRGIARNAGTPVLNVFTTLGRYRRLFRAWLRFASRLMPYGTIPRADAELVILRTALNCGNDYEWQQHVLLAQRVGLGREDIERIAAGPSAPGWSPRQQVLLTAVDEAAADRVIGEATWRALQGHYEERQLVELCLLIGHYEMLALTLNTLGVRPEQAIDS